MASPQSIVPKRFDLRGADRVLQGATHYRVFRLLSGGAVVDLSAWTGARAQLRQTRDATTIVATAAVAIVAPATDGKLSVTIPSDITAAMTVGRGFWDVELYDSSSPPVVERVIEGEWELDLEVTR